MLVYTSITKSYLPKARVLARSLKAFHPGWKFILLFSDTFPDGFQPKDEPFDEILMIEDLGIEALDAWVFSHSIVELCTAVKGPAAKLLAARNPQEKIMYLDPDIRVFASLAPLEALLDVHDVLLTPHLLSPESEARAVIGNEISALQHGVYNLGFFAVASRGDGLRFVDWWCSRLLAHCHDDIPRGLFTDQRWCDLAPGFFPRLHIVRDEGCNVATWNIVHRPLRRDAGGRVLAGGSELKFYHFTGFDSGEGQRMLDKYAQDQPVAFELWADYREALRAAGQTEALDRSWAYGIYDDGLVIPKEARVLYRRPDLRKHFPHPFQVGKTGYSAWFRKRSGRKLVEAAKNVVRKLLWWRG